MTGDGRPLPAAFYLLAAAATFAAGCLLLTIAAVCGPDTLEYS